MQHRKKKNSILNRRILILGALKGFSLFFIFERLYNLQIRQAEKYKKLADNNRINLSFVLPPRGLILDRENKSLADNKEQYQLIIKFDDSNNRIIALKKVFQYISLTKIKKEKLLESLFADKNRNQLIIKSNLSWKEVAKVSANITELQGIFIQMRLVRVYYSVPSSHLVGYVIKPEKEKNPKLSKVEGTRVGKLGIEYAFDSKLQGKFGIKKEEVNAHGRVVNEISRVNGIPGKNIKLSISRDLQDFCSKNLKNNSGSIVVMNIKTGEILSLVSNPTFNSNDFIKEMLPQKWDSIKNNQLKPLFHRACRGTYPPGSIFKLIVAIAAFDLPDFNPNKTFFCSGGFKFGDQVFHCWNDKGHGHINCLDAIAKSCDTYFYDLALKVGIDRISNIAYEFGLGEPYLEELFSSSYGLIPNKKWKKEKYNRAWTKSDTIVAGIGQGFTLSTPLQLVVMMSRIATEGKKVVPKIIKDKNISDNNYNFEEITNVTKEAYSLIKKGIFDAVNDPSGTAYASRIIDNNLFCGKTATSQVRRISMEEREKGILKNEELPRDQRDHALFAGYYPHVNPLYAFSIVVEHGGSGSKTAAPIAKNLCNKLKTYKA